MSITVSLNKDPGNDDPGKADKVEPLDVIMVDLVASEAILLPPIRMATRRSAGGEEDPVYVSQMEPPMISGGGSNWTYTYRVKENFRYTETRGEGASATEVVRYGPIYLFPFQPRDIAGNLGPMVPEFTGGTKSFEVAPDVNPPGPDDSVGVRLSKGAADASQMITYTLAFTATEALSEPSARLGGAALGSWQSSDNMSWTGTVMRAEADDAGSAPFLNLSIARMGSSSATSYSGRVNADDVSTSASSPTSLALLSSRFNTTFLKGTQPDAVGLLTYTLTFTANEEVAEPLGRFGTSRFHFWETQDNKTWTGLVRRHMDAAAETSMSITVTDFGGNPTLFSVETVSTDEISTDAPTPVAFSKGVPDRYFHRSGDPGGFVNDSYPLVINFEGSGFGGGAETLTPMGSQLVHYENRADESASELNLTFLQNTPDNAFFSMQFFGEYENFNDVDLRSIDPGTSRIYPNFLDYQSGRLIFDIKVTSSANYGGYGGLNVKLDHNKSGQDHCACETTLRKGAGQDASGNPQWETISLPISGFDNGGVNTLDLTRTKTAIVLWPPQGEQAADDNTEIVISLCNLRLDGDLEDPPTPPPACP